MRRRAAHAASTILASPHACGCDALVRVGGRVFGTAREVLALAVQSARARSRPPVASPAARKKNQLRVTRRRGTRRIFFTPSRSCMHVPTSPRARRRRHIIINTPTSLRVARPPRSGRKMLAHLVSIVRGLAYIVNDLIHEPEDDANVSLVECVLSLTQFAALIFEVKEAIPFLQSPRAWPSEEQWLQSIAVAGAASETEVKRVPLAVATSIASAQTRQAAIASRRETAIFWCRLSFIYVPLPLHRIEPLLSFNVIAYHLRYGHTIRRLGSCSPWDPSRSSWTPT